MQWLIYHHDLPNCTYREGHEQMNIIFFNAAFLCNMWKEGKLEYFFQKLARRIYVLASGINLP
jgi:hypothetical protein